LNSKLLQNKILIKNQKSNFDKHLLT
jgi:hypothetical protein